jgi:hydrogenase maturation factor HypE
MTVGDYIINSYTRRQIDRMADKIIAKQIITVKDLNYLIRLLGSLARHAMRKKNYGAVRSFCAGLTHVFKRADELTFDEKTMIPINNIRKIASDMLSKTEEEVTTGEEGYGGIGDITTNIRDALNQLAASIKKEEIPKAIAAGVKS